MASVRSPVGNYVTLPPDGTEMRPANWHALIDGLEAEEFGASDFWNGDARVIARSSDVSSPPGWAQGLVWSDPSEIVNIYADSNVSMPYQMLTYYKEMVCWSDSPVSLGTPVYIEDVVELSDEFLVPKVNVTIQEQSDPWKPAMGFAQHSTGGSEYVSVGMAGFMYAICAATAVTCGDFAVFPAGTETYIIPADGSTWSLPTSGMIIGAIAENDTGASERPILIYKGIKAHCEDRN